MLFDKIKNPGSQSLPLYSYVESLIRNKILRNQLEPGQKMPNEDELAKQLGVSVITIRSALTNLNKEGLIERIRPKGTFVSKNIPEKEYYIITGGVHDIVKEALKYDVKLLGIRNEKVERSRNPKELKEFLGLKNGDEISVIHRVRTLNDNPIFLVENFIPTSIAEHLDARALSEKPLLRILKERIGLSIGKGEMYIEAIPAEPDLADIMQAEAFAPMILMQVYYWFSSGEPFEIVNLFMKSDYFKYKITLDAKGFENI